MLLFLLACAKPAPPPPAAPAPEVQVTVLQEGSGAAQVQDGSFVSMHYELRVEGEVMDSSYSRGRPLDFTMGENEVIRGWEIGVEGMRVGEKRALVVPPALGYGSQGAGRIPPTARCTSRWSWWRRRTPASRRPARTSSRPTSSPGTPAG